MAFLHFRKAIEGDFSDAFSDIIFAIADWSPEIIHSNFLAHLRSKGIDVWDVRESGWSGRSDSDLLGS